MAPKTQALVTMWVSVALVALPGLASLALQYNAQKIAITCTILFGVVGVVYHAYQTAISQLSPVPGGAPLPPPPATPIPETKRGSGSPTRAA